MPSTVAVAILVGLAGVSVQALPQPFVPYSYGHGNYTGTAVSFNTAAPTGARGYNASWTTIATTTKSATVPSVTTSSMPTGTGGYSAWWTMITATTRSVTVPSVTTSSMPTGAHGDNASWNTIAINTHSATVPSVTTSSATVNSDAAASSASAAAASVGRFNTLLTVDGAGKELLCGDDLNKRVVFDFNKAKATGDGGRVSLANEDTFPIVTELGISTAVAFLNPCGINTPHIHPRATEFLTVVQGKVQTGFVLENGFVIDKTGLSAQVGATLEAFQGTVFPQGSIHYQFNPTCEPATFVATLNSADPGTSQIAQNFLSLDSSIVGATLGAPAYIDGANIDQFRHALPRNLVQGVESCLAACKIQKK
ncbi:hypothetical protein LTR66_002088 [Elasticomyces elasticus]|nr:hypothetical protein LTR66_002088 [Elasticomyces elasticus]